VTGRPTETLRVLLTGAAGQVGVAVQQRAPTGVVLHALDSAALDITNQDAVRATVTRLCPDVILNAAAYTAVDQAESEPERAFRVNREGAAYLAAAASSIGARMIQISTDFVFDGAQRTPYRPDASCRPLNVYGASKRAGEEVVLELGGTPATVIRTSWVYAARGQNFVRTMLRLMRDRREVRVVNDQVGSPTWATGLADALWSLARRRELAGVFHWADAGAASWYDLACAIQEEGASLGLLSGHVTVEPIPGAEFPTPARRPPFSVLDTSYSARELGLEPVPWRDNLRKMLEGLPRNP
jgi:dTDP-4-dehydrorhamnose reductase